MIVKNLPRGKQGKLITDEIAYGCQFGHEVLLDAGTGFRVEEDHKLGKKITVLDGPYANASVALPANTTIET